MNSQFIIKQLTNEQSEIYDRLIKDGYGKLTAKALALRNFSMSDKLIHYSLLHDIDKAVDYLFQYLLEEKPICIVADYDVDGATSCSIMTKGLRMLGNQEKINYFVPNRFKHGYGLQPSVIDDMLAKYPDTKLIITVDNGIASIDGVNYAKKLGIEVLVTDHHLEGEHRPDALCIVNPNKKDCTFPSKALAGCGVAFYLIKALHDKFKEVDLNQYNKMGMDFIQKAQKAKISVLFDYLAIGTIADVVSLDENNRLIVQFGLNKIHNKQNSIGVQALLDTLDIPNEKLNSVHIAFQIAPILNAAGRIEDMGKGIDLLLSDDYQSACMQAMELIEINRKRKEIEKDMKDNALTQLYSIDSFDDNSSNQTFCRVVYDENFHEGVIGILASRIKDMFYLPTIVFSKTESDDGKVVLKGSGRSIDEIHLRDAIDYVFKNTTDCVIKFGGHSMAAGLSIHFDKLQEFTHYLNEYCQMILNNKKPSKIIEVDENIENIDEISIRDIEELEQQIWGQHFPNPIFMGKFQIVEQRVLKNAHLKLTLKQNNNTIEAMQFFHNETYDESEDYNILFKFNINEFRGNKKIQLFVDSIFTIE